MHSGLNRSGMLRSSYLQAYEHPTKDEYVDALRL